LKTPFRRGHAEVEEAEPLAHQLSRSRPRPQQEQKLMYEARTHWGRGLWIVVGMVATVIAFLVILQLVPKPGDGNPIDALSNALSTAQATPSAPATAAASATPAVATVESRATAGPSATGTPTPKFVGVPRAGAPNVRNAPNTNNNPIGALAPGRQVEVIGKSADNAWLQIIWDNNQKAWVAQDLVSLIAGDPGQLPVVR